MNPQIIIKNYFYFLSASILMNEFNFQRLVNFLGGFLIAFGMPQLLHANTFADSQLNFTLALPDGFTERPDLLNSSQGIVHAFQYGRTEKGQLPVVLLIQNLGGTIGREHPRPGDMPPGFNGKLFTTKWHQFEVDGFEVPEEVNGTKTITYNVQIPLRNAAVQVKLFGAVDRKDELDSLLPKVLDGLQGESNWNSSAAPASLAGADSYSTALLCCGIAGIVAGLAILWFISLRAPKGTVLAIAVVIYIASWSIDQIRIREVQMLCGSMRFLGFSGAILGVIDIWRKRARKPSSEPGVPPNVAPPNK